MRSPADQTDCPMLSKHLHRGPQWAHPLHLHYAHILGCAPRAANSLLHLREDESGPRAQCVGTSTQTMLCLLIGQQR